MTNSKGINLKESPDTGSSETVNKSKARGKSR